MSSFVSSLSSVVSHAQLRYSNDDDIPVGRVMRTPVVLGDRDVVPHRIGQVPQNFFRLILPESQPCLLFMMESTENHS